MVSYIFRSDLSCSKAHYINNTMNIIKIFKHFNFTKCFGFHFGTLKGIALQVSVFYKPIIKLGRFNWTGCLQTLKYIVEIFGDFLKMTNFKVGKMFTTSNTRISYAN
jgi:hypothetical protein